MKYSVGKIKYSNKMLYPTGITMPNSYHVKPSSEKKWAHTKNNKTYLW